MESCLDGTDEILKNREVRSVKNKGQSMYGVMGRYGRSKENMQGQKCMKKYNKWCLCKLVLLVLPFLFLISHL